jgi:hypothetical protein
VSSEVDVRWAPAYKDVSPETKERPPLEAVTDKGGWECWSECNRDL